MATQGIKGDSPSKTSPSNACSMPDAGTRASITHAVTHAEAMSTEPPPTLTPKLRWYQVSLAELFGLTTLVALTLSLIKCFPWSAPLVVSINVWVVVIYIDRRLLPRISGRPPCRYSYALIFFLLCGPFGAIVWLALHLWASAGAAQPLDQYTGPEDALAAARQLDRDGKWDAAVLLYAQIAERWPERAQDARECIRRGEKRLSGERS